MADRTAVTKGRGALSNRESRFLARSKEVLDDGWLEAAENLDTSAVTTVAEEEARSLICRNNSPDIGFDQSINPFRGCEHGCIYCYARPSHAYLGLSPGLDFETHLVVKTNARDRLWAELKSKRYICKPIALGANTDPYQPIERRYRITRTLLELLRDVRHPVIITTKSSLVARDLDVLQSMAAEGLVEVQVSITTLDAHLARIMEPRATAPHRRMETIETLSSAGVPVRVLIAPIIPFLNDADLERILAEAAARGARSAGYVMLRLPLEIKELFQEWLRAHFPEKANRVLACITDMHGGRLYDPRYRVRQTGTGAFADLIRQRFSVAVRRAKLDPAPAALTTLRFRPPGDRSPEQTDLFR